MPLPLCSAVKVGVGALDDIGPCSSSADVKAPTHEVCTSTHLSDTFWFPPHRGYAWTGGRWRALVSAAEIRAAGAWATSAYRPTTLTLRIVPAQVPLGSFPLDCHIVLHTNQYKALGRIIKTLTSQEEIVEYLIPLDWDEIPVNEFIHQLGCSVGDPSVGNSADILCIKFSDDV